MRQKVPQLYKKPVKEIVKSIRMPITLVNTSMKATEDLGISWSDFVRQAINRNIYMSQEAERNLQELIRKAATGVH